MSDLICSPNNRALHKEAEQALFNVLSVRVCLLVQFVFFHRPRIILLAAKIFFSNNSRNVIGYMPAAPGSSVAVLHRHAEPLRCGRRWSRNVIIELVLKLVCIFAHNGCAFKSHFERDIITEIAIDSHAQHSADAL